MTDEPVDCIGDDPTCPCNDAITNVRRAVEGTP